MKKSTGKAKRKPFKVGESLPNDMIDKLSELFNQSYFYTSKPDYASAMKALNDVFSKVSKVGFSEEDVASITQSLAETPSSVIRALKNSQPSNPETKNSLLANITAGVAKARQPNHNLIKANTFALWEEMKPDILAKHKDYEPLIAKLDDALFSAFTTPPEQWPKQVNSAMAPFRRRADALATEAKVDMLELWTEVAYGDRRQFDIPWLRDIKLAEKFKPYLDGGEDDRYIYKGFKNQALIARSIEGGRDTIMVTKTDLMDLYAHDFEPDATIRLPRDKQRMNHAYQKMKGTTSITSIFRPNIIKNWLLPNGEKFYVPKGKSPTPEQIKGLKLQENTFIAGFSTFPVWSVSDLKDKFSPEAIASIEKLKKARLPKALPYLSGEKMGDLRDVVQGLIEEQKAQQSIEVRVGGNSAAYSPSKDVVMLPDDFQFDNPISLYASWAHELSHSTKHILGRPLSGGMHADTAVYAAEELVAESTSYVMVKALEVRLKDLFEGNMPVAWNAAFESYYESSIGYNQGWGDKVSFSELFEGLMDKQTPGQRENKKLDNLMNNIIESIAMIKTGEYLGRPITPEMRAEALKINIEKHQKNEHKPLIDSPKMN